MSVKQHGSMGMAGLSLASERDHLRLARCLAGCLLGMVALILLSGCSGYRTYSSGSSSEHIIGSGVLVTREIDASDFDAVEARSAFKVDIYRSESYQVSITADDNVIDNVEATVQGGVLRLAMVPGSYTNATFRAKIGLPSLRSLDLSEATTATVSGFESQEDASFRLSGASKLMGRMEAGAVNLRSGEASVVSLGGTAESLTMDASGASEVNLGDWVADSAAATMKGASRATLNVTGRLDAELREASTLYYVGSPTIGTVSSEQASALKHR